ncbi:TlpA family protein disulfide reductase [Geodermatophilus marinus]|nr:TlpA family protein disulfide reductase [Geodermatophilus sp. LHW52908]
MLLAAALAGCGTSGGGTGGSGADSGGAAAAPPSAAVPDTTTPCPEQPAEPASGSEVLADLSFDCLAGGELDLGRAQGLPTVVNLWASWCGPCREELPIVQQLADAGGDRLRVLGLVSQDPAENGRSFAADAGITMPTAVDERGDLAIEQGLRGLPYTYFLRADGSVAHLQLRPVRSYEELRDLVAEHLGVQL